MHVFLYEWITGGGLVDESGRLPASLAAEGAAMVSALADDFLKIDACRVSAVRDMRLDEPPLAGCAVTEIHSGSHLDEESAALAEASDVTLVVAPEFDGILRRTTRRLRLSDARLLNASDEFVTITSDKRLCAERLQAAGVNVPEAVVVEADQERLPAEFEYPAVLKPLDGAGSQHTLMVQGPGDEPAPHPWPRLLTRFRPGRPASVSFLCGPSGNVALPPCWQSLSADGRFTYRGGAVMMKPPLIERATRLATAALDALPPAHGYVGVDVVLGNAADGSEDYAIEVNPRVTTSYVGLRNAVKNNLAEAMLDAAAGQRINLAPADQAIEFNASGAVWRANRTHF